MTSFIVTGIVHVANAQDSVLVKVEPELIEYHANATGQQFNVSVKIYNVSNLYGFDLQLKWNTTYFEYVSHTAKVPKNTSSDGVLYSPILPLRDDVDDVAGTYWVAYSSMAPAPAFSGNGTVFIMTFRVKYHPAQPEADVYADFDFIPPTDLADKDAQPIPHVVETGTVTLYALEVPIARDAAVTNVVPAKAVVYQNASVSTNVTVKNLGTETISFDVKAYYNDTEIGTTTVSDLTSEGSKIVSFSWNTTGVPAGNYTLSATAFLTDDQNATNDHYVDGIVWIKILAEGILGDVNGDGLVNFEDVVAACLAYHATPEDSHWNAAADLAPPEDYIDIFDIVTIIWYWSESLD
jgi:hypothetical protein